MKSFQWTLQGPYSPLSREGHIRVGVEDDVTHTSLEFENLLGVAPGDAIRCKFWGLGADGTVGANKTAIKIIAENTDFTPRPILPTTPKNPAASPSPICALARRRSSRPTRYFLPNTWPATTRPTFTSTTCSKGIKKGAIFVLNSPWSTAEMETELPAHMRRTDCPQAAEVLQHRRR